MALSILRNGHVALSILGVSGHEQLTSSSCHDVTEKGATLSTWSSSQLCLSLGRFGRQMTAVGVKNKALRQVCLFCFCFMFICVVCFAKC